MSPGTLVVLGITKQVLSLLYQSLSLETFRPNFSAMAKFCSTMTEMSLPSLSLSQAPLTELLHYVYFSRQFSSFLIIMTYHVSTALPLEWCHKCPVTKKHGIHSDDRVKRRTLLHLWIESPVVSCPCFHFQSTYSGTMAASLSGILNPRLKKHISVELMFWV